MRDFAYIILIPLVGAVIGGYAGALYGEKKGAGDWINIAAVFYAPIGRLLGGFIGLIIAVGVVSV